MKLRTQLLLGYTVVFALMVINAALMYKSTNWLIESQNLVEETSRAVASAGRLQTITMEMQSAKRGFLISGSDDLLQPFAEARAAYRQEMERLKEIVSDNRSQVRRLEEVDAFVNRWIETVAVAQIEARRKGVGEEGSTESILTRMKEDKSGRALFRDIYRSIEAFEESQHSLSEQQSRENNRLATRSVWSVIVGTVVAVVFGTVIMLITISSVHGQIGGEPATIAAIAEEIGKGNLNVQLDGESGGGTGIRGAIGVMLTSLRENLNEAQTRDWLKTGVARLNEVMSGDPEIVDLAGRAISEIATYLDAQVGAFYVAQHGAQPTFSLVGSYAYKKRKNLSDTFAIGEGLVGQAALEKTANLAQERTGRLHQGDVRHWRAGSNLHLRNALHVRRACQGRYRDWDPV